tara:strand:- start:865 stop:1317 length:453 start_codon:yes stop_codon:yes gene_type:complete
MPKGNGKPKERSRSVALDIDVSEIAQKLADRNELSSTISELLRQAYGFGDKIEEKKRELHAILDEKQRLVAKEIELSAQIDTLEAKKVNEKATIYPQLRQRLEILENRRRRVQAEANNAIDPHTTNQKLRAMTKIDELIENTKIEMEEFE